MVDAGPEPMYEEIMRVPPPPPWGLLTNHGTSLQPSVRCIDASKMLLVCCNKIIKFLSKTFARLPRRKNKE